MASFLEESSHDLCFDREIFFSSDFSVDKFVCEKRKAVGLEQLRQDLRSHLNYLQECLVELINEHYTDFVSLSSNLVGLEKYIGNTSQPLTKLKDEVSEIATVIEAVVRETEQKLDERQSDRRLRGQTLLALEVYRGVHRLPKQDEQWNPDLVERTASQIHSLAASLERCRNVALAQRAADVIEGVKSRLQSYLETKLLEALQKHNELELHHVLQVAVSLDRVSAIEAFYSERVVKPALADIVSERVLREVLTDGLFNQVIMFVTTSASSLMNCAPAEYDFIVRSIFPVFVSLAETRIPTLFSLTSATMFHRRYCEAQRFLDTLESHLSPKSRTSSAFRNSDAYKAFMAKWSVGVYFQLRYTEIATNFETALLVGNEPFARKSSRHLSVTDNLYKQIAYCWSDGVFIHQLKPKLLRLTLQLLSRYATFLQRFAEQRHPVRESNAELLLQAAADCQHITLESIRACCSELQLQQQQQEETLFTECVQESLVTLASLADKLSTSGIELLCQLAQQSIKQITDIPRLYRRTNREMPNAASGYVSALFEPIFNCQRASTNWLPKWSAAFANSVCDAFLTTTQDVLESVRKMEDSLRRLKKGKINETAAAAAAAAAAAGGGAAGGGGGAAGGGGGGGGISDDDKIRLQIMIDVEHFGKLLVALAGETPPNYDVLFDTARNQMNANSGQVLQELQPRAN